jgi:hypothetical protein
MEPKALQGGLAFERARIVDIAAFGDVKEHKPLPDRNFRPPGGIDTDRFRVLWTNHVREGQRDTDTPQRTASDSFQHGSAEAKGGPWSARPAADKTGHHAESGSTWASLDRTVLLIG